MHRYLAPFATRLFSLGLLAATLCFFAAAAHGRTIYRGIGNDEFSDDIDTMIGCLQSCLEPGDLDLRIKQRTGMQIETIVNGDAALCGNNDIYIFHYAGHGSFQADDDIGEDPNDDDETIGIGGVGLTDDELAAAMQNVPPGCTVLVIMDSCFGGGFVGGSEDLDRAGIDAKNHLSMLASAPKTCEAPGNSTLLADICSALTPLGTTVVGDTNGDGRLTMTELFVTVAADVTNVENYYDWSPFHDGMILWHQPNYVPAIGSLAPVLALMLLGIAGLRVWRSGSH